MITIHSNGSKWAGEQPDSIDKLKDMLRTQTLDKTFEEYGNFVFKSDNKKHYCLFGNFKTYSHVFNIDTDDKKLVNEIRQLVRENKKRSDYNN